MHLHLTSKHHTTGDQTCPECRGTLQTSGTEVICTTCHRVIEESPIDHGPDWRNFDDTSNPERCYPTDRNRDDRGLGSMPPVFTEDAPEVAHRNTLAQTSTTQKSRNRSYACAEIDRIVAALRLSDSISAQAKYAFRQWHDAEHLLGKSLDRIAPAAVLYAARDHQAGLTARHICPHARPDSHHVIINVMLELVDAIDETVPLPSLSARLNRLIGQNDFDVHPDTRTHAHAILDASPPSSRSPSALAVTALYIAGGARSPSTSGTWTQAELADAANISPKTIQDTAPELRPVAERLSPSSDSQHQNTPPSNQVSPELQR